jgi:hypothetical protein
MSKKIIYDFRAGPAPNQDTSQPQRLEWYPGEPAYLFSQREGYNDEADHRNRGRGRNRRNPGRAYRLREIPEQRPLTCTFNIRPRPL